MWQDEDVRKQLEKIGLNVTKEMEQDYFVVNDHSLNVITEANHFSKKSDRRDS